jgi:hypothetical protein
MRANVFRFAPKSGHCAIESACPFRANNRLMRRSKSQTFYLMFTVILSETTGGLNG